MSFKFDPINQTVIEVKEASRWERRKRKRITSPLTVFKFAVAGLIGNYLFWNAIIALTSN